MTDLDTGSATAETEDARPDAAELKPGRVKTTNYNGKTDPFAVAFNAAKDEIEGDAEKSKPGPKVGSKKAPQKPVAKATEAEADDSEGDEPKRKIPPSSGPSAGDQGTGADQRQAPDGPGHAHG